MGESERQVWQEANDYAGLGWDAGVAFGFWFCNEFADGHNREVFFWVG